MTMNLCRFFVCEARCLLGILWFALAGLCWLPAPARGEFGIVVIAIGLFNEAAESFPDNGLLQIVNLGPNRVFDPVVEGSWVGGDDVVINLPFGSIEFSTSGGFDLLEGGVAGDPGYLERIFSFPDNDASLQSGDFLGLRWWPTFAAGDFADGLVPSLGTVYGQARVDAADVAGLDAPWVVPVASESLTIFQPLLSESFNLENGTDFPVTPGYTGMPLFSVVAVPEPAGAAVIVGLGLLMAGFRFSSVRRA